MTNNNFIRKYRNLVFAINHIQISEVQDNNMDRI